MYRAMGFSGRPDGKYGKVWRPTFLKIAGSTPDGVAPVLMTGQEYGFMT
jgi:hypothetical protein